MAGKKKKVEAPPKRDSVLFARIQKKNKEWLSKEAKRSEFSDVASFLDAMISVTRVS